MGVRTRSVKYHVLSRENCAAISEASLEMLERTGCRVEEPESLELLKAAGCFCDGQRVRIPNHVVKKSLQTTPQKVVLYNRLGQRAMIMEGTNSYYGTGSDCPFTIDIESGEHRKTCKADVVAFARLVDALPNLDFVMSMAIASDANQHTSFVHQFQAMVENTSKPIVITAHGMEDMRDIHAMASAIKGGAENLRREPFMLLYSEPIAPHVHSVMGLEKLIFCARNNIPVTYPTGAMAGATAPATMAGAIALGNAECLTGLVIHQLAQPGAPFVFGGNSTIMDMTTGGVTYAAPELHMAHSAYADLAKYYGIPAWGLSGASDSKVMDAQAGLELGMQVLMAELSGAQLIHDMGYLESGLCSSMEMVCLGNEMISMARHISRGIKVTPETLAVDEVDQVGPGGNFLESQYTLDHYRSESWFPEMLSRIRFQDWQERGSLTLTQRLNAKVKEILASHKPVPLSAEIRKKMAGILQKREKKFAAG